MTNTIDINGLPYMLVGDIQVGTATTSVSFTGLDIGKDDDYLLVSDIYSTPSLTGVYRLTVNGNNTITNYYVQWLFGSNTSVSANRQNECFFSAIDTYSLGARTTAFTKLKLTNSGYYVWQTQEDRYYGGTNASLVNHYGTSTFTATSITSLTITSVTPSAIGIGSRFQLYKLVAEKVADIIVTTATTSVDITGLNIGKDVEYMLVSDVVNATALGRNYYLCINGNSTITNYYTQDLTAAESAYAASRYNAPLLQYNKETSKSVSFNILKLTNSGYFVRQTNIAREYGASTVGMSIFYANSTFAVTSITQFTISADAAYGISIGSRFTLYKLK